VRRTLNPMKSLYEQNGVTDRSLRRDLNLFITAVAMGSIFFSISTGTPFTGYASALGANDFYYGILLAIPVAVSFLQFAASWLLEKTRKRKLIFVATGIVQRLLWLPIALVPLFIPLDRPELRLWMVILLMTLSSSMAMFMNVMFFSWLGDVVPMRIRGRYLGLRYSIFTFTGLVSAIAASAALDSIHGLTGYMVVFGVASLFGVADIVQFLWVRDPPMTVEKHESFKSAFAGVFRDTGFWKYLLFWTAWSFCWNLPGPFYSKYAIDKLHLSLTVTTLAGQVAYGVMAVLMVRWWGRMLDRRGHHWLLTRCCAVFCVSPLVWLFASPGVVWPMLVSSLMTGIFFCGIDVTSVQMLVTVTPLKNRSVYIAMYMVVTSLVGISLANAAGGWLLKWLGDVSFSFLGVAFDRYKLLFAGTCALRVLVIALLLPMIANIKPQIAERVETETSERMESNGRKELA
jgi:MFS family permease